MFFNLEIWYLCNGGNDKDFFQERVEADNLEQAKQKAESLHRFVFKVYEV